MDSLSDECLAAQSAGLTVMMTDWLLDECLVEQMADLMAASLTEELDEMMAKMKAVLMVWSLAEQTADMKAMTLGCLLEDPGRCKFEVYQRRLHWERGRFQII